MRKLVIILFPLLILGFVAWHLYTYWSVGRDGVPDQLVIVDNNLFEEANQDEKIEVSYEIVEVVRGLKVPWSIVFTDTDRILVSERRGTVREIVNGSLVSEPLHTFGQVTSSDEEGLMGMAIDPDYEKNKYIYFCYAYDSPDGMFDRVSRLVDDGNGLTDEVAIIEDIPAARFHAGCRIKFGPDAKLYITTGDATDKNIAQDLSSLGGKILRIDSDGSIPDDNPYPDSPVWSLGHRNSQGIDWHTSGVLYSTEHGPSGFDGPAGGDEVNVIIKAGNYGWPLVSHDKSREGSIDPVLVFTPAFAPASGMFYKGDLLPQFKDNFFFGGLRGEGIMRVMVSIADPTKVVAYEKLPNINYGRIREIVEAPDGSIYFSTSNLDGRGNANDGDDKIYQIRPTSRGE